MKTPANVESSDKGSSEHKQELAYVESKLSNPSYFIATADPQFPWISSRNLNGEPVLPKAPADADREECEAEIKAQYNAIQAFRKSHAGKIIPVMVNGDITAFGLRVERQFMYNDALPIMGEHVYLGLGNHDYDNNVDSSYDNDAATGSVVDFKNYMFNASGKVDNCDYDIDRSLAWEGWGGSFAYSKTIGDIHLIQLNYWPDYLRKWNSSTPPRTFNITSSIAWLENDWKQAKAANKIIIVNMHSAPASGNRGWHSDAIKRLVDDYPPAVVFAGHIHMPHKVDDAYDTFGTVPVFIAGATFERQFILAEYNLDQKKMWVYNVVNNDFANKLAMHKEVLDFPPDKPSFHFYTSDYHWLTMAWNNTDPALTYELSNDKGQIIKVTGHTYTQWDLQEGTYYEFRLRAIRGNACSGWSVAGGTTMPILQIPEVVVWDVPVISASDVELHWFPVDTEDSSWMASYMVYQDDVAITQFPGTTRNFLTASNLKQGQTYRFQVIPYIPQQGKKNEPLVITL